ncbi:MAG TPA: DUF2281 domain-containing protein [Mucilaginibacter sp.]
MGTGTIEKKFEQLPDNLKLKVEGYIDALLSEINIAETNALTGSSQKGSAEVKSGFGGGKGIIVYMADDFDAPLDDFKDYM